MEKKQTPLTDVQISNIYVDSLKQVQSTNKFLQKLGVQMKTEIDYDVYCDNEWVAGANNLDEAIRYAQQYREEGRVEVFEVKKKSEVVFIGSKLK